MALSGSFDYVVTASQLITDALENINVIVPGETIDSNDQATALRALNLIAKQWSSLGDQMPGMKVWLRKQAFLFPQKGQASYTLGSTSYTSDKIATAYTRDTLNGALAALATAVTVDDGSATTNGDQIGIVLADGTIHWDTIASGGGTSSLVLTTGVASAANDAAYVYTYTASTQALLFKPEEVISVTLRDPNGYDRGYMTPMRDIGLYDQIPDKTRQTDPGMCWYEAGVFAGTLKFDCAFPSFSDIVNLNLLSPADDLDAVANDLAFPAVMHAGLSWELALRLCPKFQKPWTPDMDKAYNAAVGTARYINLPGAEGGYNSDDGANMDSL